MSVSSLRYAHARIPIKTLGNLGKSGKLGNAFPIFPIFPINIYTLYKSEVSMPIDYRNYPANWREISLAVREDAGWRCEFCGAVNGELHPETGSIVVLTVAHLDHDTTHNTRANLRALCQRCHLRYDAQLHAQHAAETRRRKQIEAGQIQR